MVEVPAKRDLLLLASYEVTVGYLRGQVLDANQLAHDDVCLDLPRELVDAHYVRVTLSLQFGESLERDSLDILRDFAHLTFEKCSTESLSFILVGRVVRLESDDIFSHERLRDLPLDLMLRVECIFGQEELLGVFSSVKHNAGVSHNVHANSLWHLAVLFVLTRNAANNHLRCILLRVDNHAVEVDEVSKEARKNDSLRLPFSLSLQSNRKFVANKGEKEQQDALKDLPKHCQSLEI